MIDPSLYKMYLKSIQSYRPVGTTKYRADQARFM